MAQFDFDPDPPVANSEAKLTVSGVEQSPFTIEVVYLEPDPDTVIASQGGCSNPPPVSVDFTPPGTGSYRVVVTCEGQVVASHDFTV